jgi:hypothetical protein
METAYYTISFNTERKHKFSAKIIQNEKVNDEIDGGYTVMFGGVEKCITVFIHDTELPTDAILQGLKGHPECTLSKSLDSPGSDTEVMTKCALKFILQQFPNIIAFTFIDDSKIDCKGGIRIPLYTYYLAKHGKTWYMSKFGAEPISQTIKHRLEKGTQVLFAERKPKWETFYIEYVQNKIDKRLTRTDELYNTLKRAYITSKSISAFVNEIDKKYDCAVFHGWLSTLVTRICGFSFMDEEFQIMSDVVASWYEHVNLNIRRLKSKPNEVGYGGFASECKYIFPSLQPKDAKYM